MKSILLAAAVSVALAGASGVANAQEALAKSSGCLNCHDISTKKVGPAFKDVAAKFKGKQGAEGELVAKLKSGKGHPKVQASDAELEAAVRQVLGLQ